MQVKQKLYKMIYKDGQHAYDLPSSFPLCSLYPYINSQREHTYLVNVYAIITIWLFAFNLPQSRQKRREL
jgi:hypothetical protein